MFCPNCGEQVPDRARVCGFCGQPLAARPRRRRVRRRCRRAPGGVCPAGQERRFNPLWLVLILLFLLLSCCCLLMLLGLVDAPVIAAPIVEQARQFTPIQQRPVQEKDGPKEKPAVNCEKAAERLNAVDLNGFINCMPALNQCWTELVGLDDYKDVQLDYGWDGTVQGKAACGPNILNGGKQTCIFPMDPKSDRVDFWFSIKGECRQHECWVGGDAARTGCRRQGRRALGLLRQSRSQQCDISQGTARSGPAVPQFRPGLRSGR